MALLELVDRAPCRLLPPEVADRWFFSSNRTTAADVAAAKALCASCPVRQACRQAADDAEGVKYQNRLFIYGIFGGETPQERIDRRLAARAGAVA